MRAHHFKLMPFAMKTGAMLFALVFASCGNPPTEHDTSSRTIQTTDLSKFIDARLKGNLPSLETAISKGSVQFSIMRINSRGFIPRSPKAGNAVRGIFVLEGRGTLELDTKSYPLKKAALISLPSAGAIKITAATNTYLKLLVVREKR